MNYYLSSPHFSHESGSRTHTHHRTQYYYCCLGNVKNNEMTITTNEIETNFTFNGRVNIEMIIDF